MPYFIYVLKSESSNTSYVGHTSNLEKRVVEHNNGKSLSTRGKRPWRLVYKEEYNTRSKAASREKYFKSVEGRLELRAKGILWLFHPKGGAVGSTGRRFDPVQLHHLTSFVSRALFYRRPQESSRTVSWMCFPRVSSRNAPVSRKWLVTDCEHFRIEPKTQRSLTEWRLKIPYSYGILSG